MWLPFPVHFRRALDGQVVDSVAPLVKMISLASR